MKKNPPLRNGGKKTFQKNPPLRNFKNLPCLRLEGRQGLARHQSEQIQLVNKLS